MTSKEYIERNLKGFEGDTIMRNRIAEIIKEKNLNRVIETGTFLGGTTKIFADMVAKVDTIELSDEYFAKATNYLNGIDNVTMHKGSSEKVLDAILSEVNPKSPTKNNIFCFLDAHFNEYNPLLDELAVIAKHKLKPVIAIHDFKVPNRPDLGFDVYENIIYQWNWIEESIERIYGAGKYVVEYNSEATGAKRGIIYIYPKK